MKFVDEGKPNDLFVASEGARVLVDSKTALYLRGTTLDYSINWLLEDLNFLIPMQKRVAVVVKALISSPKDYN